jgi:hypothetical protein
MLFLSNLLYLCRQISNLNTMSRKTILTILFAMLLAPASMEAKKKVKVPEVPQLRNFPSAEISEYRLHGGNVVIQGHLAVPEEAKGEKIPQEVLDKLNGSFTVIMRNYIVQIDSLNTLNHQLTADVAAARKEAAESKKANEELTQQVESLSGQVAAGSVIKARGITINAYNSTDIVTDRSSRVVRLMTSLSLVENDLAPKGPIRVYIRVKDPEGIILTNSVRTSFTFNGETMVASASREVDYEGSEVDLSIYLNEIESYVKGIYTVEVYTEQSFLGSAELMLR